MKSKEEIISRLKEHESATSSRFRENESWLRYSQRIAMMMLDRMEELGLTQKSVAAKMGCSQQYVSRVLKGTEHLSIETVSKIESALGLAILEPAFAAR